ncbi:MAG TPA: HGGxSTG domain-containing protein, partial [Candidatus Angelobacter sp.]|nr:HGGxSTG domain-containing protein [Candidatus Angelobacter sp.]
PSGDYLAAPRCGARTRAGGPCRQPAMANGRCRFHGGKSTGPRTPGGLARSRAARRTHGGYAAEIIDLRQAAAAHARRVAALRAQFGAERAENGRQKAARAGKPGAPAALIVPAVDAFGRRPSGPPCPVLAGHGVHPLFFMARRAEAPLRREGGSDK